MQSRVIKNEKLNEEKIENKQDGSPAKTLSEITLKLDKDWPTCFIGLQPIRHPVTSRDGKNYEAKVALRQLQTNGNISPNDRKTFLPLVYSREIKNWLDDNESTFEEARHPEYEIEPVLAEIEKYEQQFRKFNVPLGKYDVICDSRWFLSTLKAFGIGLSSSYFTSLLYSNFHPGEHNSNEEHNFKSMVSVPIFYMVVLLDMGARKLTRHQYGIFAGTANAIRLAIQMNRDNEPQQERRNAPEIV